MLRMRWGKIALLGVALVLVLSLLVTACDSDSDKDADDEKRVKVGGLLAFTGPASATTKPGGEAWLDWFKYVNEQGGIDGVLVDTIWLETALNYANSLIGHKKFKDARVLTEFGIGAGIEVIAPLLAKDKVSILNMMGMTDVCWTYPEQWAFVSSAGYGPEYASLLKWIADNWTGAGLPKVGMIMVDYAPGWESVKNVEEVAEEVGVEWAGYEAVPRVGVIDTSTELLRLQGKGIDWLTVAHYGGSMVVMIHDIARLLGDSGIEVIDSIHCLDDISIGITGEDSEGWYSLCVTPSKDQTEWRNMSLVYDLALEYRGLSEPSTGYVGGVLVGMVMEEAIRVAIDEVGFENLDGPAVRDAYASMKAFDTGITPPVTMTDDRPFYTNKGWMSQVQDGKLLRIDDKYVAPTWYLER
ncbi:ABC transporter substrate-binding protein [Chloroflexota bacterium]